MTKNELIESGAMTMSIREASELLRVNPRLVSKECASGAIPSLVIGRRRLILVTPLLDMLTDWIGPNNV